MKSPRVKFTCLGNGEQGVLDEVGDIELEEPSVLSDVRSTIRS